MEILGTNFEILKIYDSIVTVADSFVSQHNKIGSGHGESKLYLASKDAMRNYFGGEGFVNNCFMLKSDLLTYLKAVKKEYLKPSQKYNSISEVLWNYRYNLVCALDDVIHFKVYDQIQIEGTRGYVNSDNKEYQIIRELALPLVSYISIMQVQNSSGIFYYWKLFADFDAIANKENALVYTYGKKYNQDAEDLNIPDEPQAIRKIRIGQAKFRKQLIQETGFCPITGLDEDRLLIASHIKPYSVCSNNEKYDIKNGFVFSPLFDKLFDQGFLSFKNDKTVLLSNWLDNSNWARIGLMVNEKIDRLPLDSERIKYLEYHRDCVFKG